MKALIVIAPLLAVCVAAAAVGNKQRRQISGLEVTFIMARASTEPGNMGISMGPSTCTGLKAKYGKENVACQGVGGPYSAGLIDNFSSVGTTKEAIGEAKKMLNMAAKKCPKTIIVSGGYSQGSALIMNAVSEVDQEVKDRVVGVVLFGYTKNYQKSGGIPQFPKEKVKTFCYVSDGVCDGGILVTLAHFAYIMDGSAKDANDFLIKKIDATSAKLKQSESFEETEGTEIVAAAPKRPPPKDPSTKKDQPKKSQSKNLKPKPVADKPAPVDDESLTARLATETTKPAGKQSRS